MKRITLSFAAIALLASTVVYASGSLLWARKHMSTKLEKDEEWIQEALSVTEQSVTSLDLIEDTTEPDPVEIIDSMIVEEGTEEPVTASEEPEEPAHIEIIDSTIVEEGTGTPEEPETTEVPEESELPEAPEQPEESKLPEAPAATEAVDDSMDDIPVTYVEAQKIDIVGTPDEDMAATPDEAETDPQ